MKNNSRHTENLVNEVTAENLGKIWPSKYRRPYELKYIYYKRSYHNVIVKTRERIENSKH